VTVTDAVAALSAPLAPLDETVASLGRDPGLVAWWGTDVPVSGPAHPVDDGWVVEDRSGDYWTDEDIRALIGIIEKNEPVSTMGEEKSE